MESYNIYKKNDQYNPIYTIVSNDSQDKNIIEHEYGIYNSTISKKRENMPKGKDGKELSRGIYYYETDIPISKEGIILSRLESINKNIKICKVAAWLFIISIIISIIVGIIIGIGSSFSHRFNSQNNIYASDSDSTAIDGSSLDSIAIDSIGY